MRLRELDKEYNETGLREFDKECNQMELRELDNEYNEMGHFSDTEKIQYCEDLITRMRKRLSGGNSNSDNIRTLMLEIIETAEREMQMLIIEKNKKK